MSHDISIATQLKLAQDRLKENEKAQKLVEPLSKLSSNELCRQMISLAKSTVKHQATALTIRVIKKKRGIPLSKLRKLKISPVTNPQSRVAVLKLMKKFLELWKIETNKELDMRFKQSCKVQEEEEPTYLALCAVCESETEVAKRKKAKMTKELYRECLSLAIPSEVIDAYILHRTAVKKEDTQRKEEFIRADLKTMRSSDVIEKLLKYFYTGPDDSDPSIETAIKQDQDRLKDEEARNTVERLSILSYDDLIRRWFSLIKLALTQNATIAALYNTEKKKGKIPSTAPASPYPTFEIENDDGLNAFLDDNPKYPRTLMYEETKKFLRLCKDATYDELNARFEQSTEVGEYTKLNLIATRVILYKRDANPKEAEMASEIIHELEMRPPRELIEKFLQHLKTGAGAGTQWEGMPEVLVRKKLRATSLFEILEMYLQLIDVPAGDVSVEPAAKRPRIE